MMIQIKPLNHLKGDDVKALDCFVVLLLGVPLLLHTHLSFNHLLILFFFIGLFSSTQTLGYTLLSESNGAQYTGIAIAIASIIITGSGGVGQLLFGKLLQYHVGSPTTSFSAADFQYAFVLLPISLFIWRSRWHP